MFDLVSAKNVRLEVSLLRPWAVHVLFGNQVRPGVDICLDSLDGSQ